MHIPDGFISPAINATTAAISLSGIVLASYHVRKELDERAVPLIGVTAAFIFAAQMLNFPVLAGTSGHFLGAALAVFLLGPSASILVMSLVLLIQCLGFADGGLTALGTNVFNMGLIAGLSAYGIFHALKRLLPQSRLGEVASVGFAAWFSVVFASAAASLELALSGTSTLSIVLPAMVGVHAVIGVGEAMITVAAYSMVRNVRPDLIQSHALHQE